MITLDAETRDIAHELGTKLHDNTEGMRLLQKLLNKINGN